MGKNLSGSWVKKAPDPGSAKLGSIVDKAEDMKRTEMAVQWLRSSGVCFFYLLLHL
jgi:hypothetical protein